MGVAHEYFVFGDDEEAAASIGSPRDGVLGAEPATELVSLEALLLGVGLGWVAVKELMERPDHAVLIAADDDEDANVMMSRIADGTVRLIAEATADQLAAAMSPWSEVAEFHGRVTGAELAEMMDAVMPLFRRVTAGGAHLYVRTTC